MKTLVGAIIFATWPCAHSHSTRFLRGTGRLHAGITALDLAHTPCSDGDVAEALTKLPHLASLRLDNCRKLSSSICTTVFSHTHTHLHTLCLQRCFQVTPGTLVHALAAATTPGSSLATLTFSHIHFEGPLPPPNITLPGHTTAHQTQSSKNAVKSFASHSNSVPESEAVETNLSQPRHQRPPAATAETHTQSPSPSLSQTTHPQPPPTPPPVSEHLLQASSLRVLALSCCDGLALGHLAAVAHCAPQLEVLLLGGTALAPPQPHAAAASASAAAAPPQTDATTAAVPAAAAVPLASWQERAVFAGIEALVQRTRAALEHEAAVAEAKAAEQAGAHPCGEGQATVPCTDHGAARRPLSTLSMCAPLSSITVTHCAAQHHVRVLYMVLKLREVRSCDESILPQ